MKSKLPKYWAFRHGAYYYRPPTRFRPLFDKDWIKLGRTLPEAYRTFAELPVHDDATTTRTIADLADRYETHVVPQKAWGTQENNRRSLTTIRSVFGHIPIHSLEPRHCKEYFVKRGRTKTAKEDISVLRHMYTVAVEDWGLLKAHPIKGNLRLKNNPPRRRYVTDDELIAFRTMISDKLCAYVDLKIATGLAKEDLLCLDRADIQQDGLHARRRKTNAKPKIYTWDAAGTLRRIIHNVHAAHRGHIGSTRLFHTRDGRPYYDVDDKGYALGKPSSFNSMWQRAMTKWVESGGERFTEHDLRAKSASDANELEHAQRLMDHTNATTTEAIYRRKPRLVNIYTPDGGEDKT